jgi:hypothetical protein
MRFYEFVSNRELKTVEQIADRLWNKLGIDVEFTKHFFDRVNDPRNGAEITLPELVQLFVKEYNQYGTEIARLPNGTEVVLKDLLSDINSPIHIKKDRDGDIKMIAKTVMRNKNFKTSSKQFKVK